MEGIESSAEENKGMPEIKMSGDLSHAKKRGAISPI